MILNALSLVAATYLVCSAMLMRTENVLSSIYFKIIPMLIGLPLAVLLIARIAGPS